MSRCQGTQEKVAEFLTGLKQLFKEVYPTEQLTFTILLQCFFTGLPPTICQQLLLHGKPETLHQVADNMTAIEYAFNFEEETDDFHEVAAVHHKSQPQSFEGTQKQQNSLDEIVKHLEALETYQQPVARPQRYYDPQRRRWQNRTNGGADLRCWLCGELGNMKRQCPLNYSGPAEMVDSWPQQ